MNLNNTTWMDMYARNRALMLTLKSPKRMLRKTPLDAHIGLVKKAMVQRWAPVALKEVRALMMQQAPKLAHKPFSVPAPNNDEIEEWSETSLFGNDPECRLPNRKWSSVKPNHRERKYWRCESASVEETWRRLLPEEPFPSFHFTITNRQRCLVMRALLRVLEENDW
jgi:hypothetical protein